MQIFLETERLVLRRFTPDDVDNLVELDSDPQVMHFITGGRPTSREEIEHDLLPWFLHYYEGATGTASGRRSRSRPGRSWAGSTSGRRTVARADEPELGYRLRRSAWGKGYATEGSRALIRKGFTELGVRAGGRGDDGGQHGIPPGHGEVQA